MYFHFETTILGILWANPKPSSTRYCRPIRFSFIKETTEVIKNEVKTIEDQIKNLIPFNFKTESGVIEISFVFVLTMIDGKVCNAVTGTTSTKRCYICGATSKHLNNLKKLKKFEPNPENYSFGMSTLHRYLNNYKVQFNILFKIFYYIYLKVDKML